MNERDYQQPPDVGALQQRIRELEAQLAARTAALRELYEWVRDSDCCYGGSCIAMETEARLKAALGDLLQQEPGREP